MARSRRPASRVTATALTVALLALAGCSDDGGTDRGVPAATTTATSESRVIAPGRPGETADVIEPGEQFELTEDGHSELEVRFIEQMIPHHRQALEMALLAPDRSADERVLLLAESIAVSQESEIVALESWLTQRDLPVPEAGDNSHAGMAGMVTPFQLQLLEDSSGREFDEMFLTYMSEHHTGAIEMAAPVISSGIDIMALEMATDISVTQTAEINRMRDILDTL